MKLREKFFDSLAKLPARERAAVLIPAFERARDDECTAVAEQLARTGDGASLRALIRHWNRIAPECRRAIAHMVRGPRLVISSIILAEQAQILRHIVDFIGDRADALLASALVDVLEHKDADLRSRAAAALLRLTVDLLGPRGMWTADPRPSAELDAAIARAMDGYRSHRCDDVLLAAAIVAGRPGPKLQSILAQADHPGTTALRGVPRHMNVDLVCMNLIRWLDVPSMQRPALRWLDSIRTAGQWNDVLAVGHLLASPARRRTIRRHPTPRRLLPKLAHAARLDSRAQTNLIDWVRACGLNGTERVAYLRDLIALPAPLARVKAVRSLAELADAGVDGAAEALGPFARDSNASVARYARRALRRPADVAFGITHRGADAPESWWDEINPYARVHVAFRQAARDPDQAADVLGTMLRSNVRERALSALMLIERLGFHEQMKCELLAATDSDDSHIAASAARVVGREAVRTGDPSLIGCLRRMLDHDNARVRANAVEVLAAAQRAASNGTAAEAMNFSSFTTADENRLRANAIRAMLLAAPLSSDAISMWKAMVRDDRPLHRISAIWVAGRTPMGMMREELYRLSSPEEEPLPEVRTRAEAAARWVAQTRQVQDEEICVP